VCQQTARVQINGNTPGQGWLGVLVQTTLLSKEDSAAPVQDVINLSVSGQFSRHTMVGNSSAQWQVEHGLWWLDGAFLHLDAQNCTLSAGSSGSSGAPCDARHVQGPLLHGKQGSKSDVYFQKQRYQPVPLVSL